MENATKALLMAGGVLIAIITISVLVITFQKFGNVSKTYDSTITQEEITKFNTNFTKYLGQDLTIHEVVTISNFARENGINPINGKKQADIEDIVREELKDSKKKAYHITNIKYGADGKVSSITFD